MIHSDIENSGRVLSTHEQRNREIVIDYYTKLIGAWDYDAASVHLGERFVQHNPTIADGLAGLEAFVRHVPPPVAEAMRCKIVRVVVDGDFVVLHNRMTMPGTPDTVVLDLFRLENYKVVEHWDVIQAVPADSLHGNAMV